jgi:environmental stress-induced protein Ves
MTESTQTFRSWTEMDYQKKPWQNGGGNTEELLAFPTAQDYLWRMSVASIEKSGPFSIFKNYQRILVPLSGSIILKHSNGKQAPLKKRIPYSFSGDLATDCTLESKDARDFNLIYKADLMAAEIFTHTIEKTTSLKISGTQDFIYCIEGELLITSPASINETVKVAAHGLCELAHSGNTERINLRPTGKSPTTAIFLHIILNAKSQN